MFFGEPTFLDASFGNYLENTDFERLEVTGPFVSEGFLVAEVWTKRDDERLPRLLRRMLRRKVHLCRDGIRW